MCIRDSFCWTFPFSVRIKFNILPPFLRRTLSFWLSDIECRLRLLFIYLYFQFWILLEVSTSLEYFHWHLLVFPHPKFDSAWIWIRRPHALLVTSITCVTSANFQVGDCQSFSPLPFNFECVWYYALGLCVGFSIIWMLGLQDLSGVLSLGSFLSKFIPFQQLSYATHNESKLCGYSKLVN